MRRAWRRVEWRDRQDVTRIGLAFTGALIGWRLVAETFTLFRNAYLHTAWIVPGGGVPSTYWSAIRFAFDATVLAAAGGGVCLSLGVLELGRLGRR